MPVDGVRYCAVLVESIRSPAGSPRQRHVAFLGSITYGAIQIPAQRRWFWDKVLKRLDALNITPETRQRFITTIARKVPGPPTDAEREQLDRELQELTEALRNNLKSAEAAGRPHCSFCGKTDQKVKTLVTAGRVAICNECVDLSVETIRKHQASPPQLSVNDGRRLCGYSQKPKHINGRKSQLFVQLLYEQFNPRG